MEWQSLDPATQCLCYALGHQYTSAALRLASLKGYDYCQARFVADVCNQVDSFHVLLARMEKTLSNYENGDETFEILLKQIFDLEGFLLRNGKLSIPEIFILQRGLYRSRDPDDRTDVDYTGNECAEIHEVYNDTVNPKCE